MAKKKLLDDDLTLIQCSVRMKRRVKDHAKAKGYLLNKMVDKIFGEYLTEKEAD